jgi:hypothetical protein
MTCPSCNRPLSPYRRRGTRFCSPACKQWAYRRRQRLAAIGATAVIAALERYGSRAANGLTGR